MRGSIKIHGLIGITLLVLATVLMRQGQEPFATYFYCFAWWSYILIADALVYYIQGESLILNRTYIFFMMIPWSIFVWCIFEAFNVRLANWHYINVPQGMWYRWIGYAAAYGTVLPGLCETAHLLKVMGLFRDVSWKGMNISSLLLRALIFFGIICLLATLLFPYYCFPLVWMGFAFLLDPFNYRYGGDSILRQIENGDFKLFLILLAAGLICGVLWELWNFWAPTKWIYTVPFFERVKLFEMPILGFLGFPPFTVSAFVIYHSLLLLRCKGGIWIRGTLWFLLPLFCLIVFAGIDRFSVVSHIPLIRDMPEVQEELKGRLQVAGIEKVHDLIYREEKGLITIGISHREIDELLRKARLITLKGIGMENYRLLQKVGVNSLSELAQQNPLNLSLRLEEISRRQNISRHTITLDLVKLWVQEAKRRLK
jgi:hypothetical protein